MLLQDAPAVGSGWARQPAEEVSGKCETRQERGIASDEAYFNKLLELVSVEYAIEIAIDADAIARAPRHAHEGQPVGGIGELCFEFCP